MQIAKARGAHVIGTARSVKHEFLRGLGADELVDYTETDFETAVEPVDVVVGTIGGAYGPRSLRALRPGGVLVSLASPAEAYLADEAAPLGLRAAFMIVEADQAGMQQVAALVESGRLRPEIATVLPLDQAATAHELGDMVITGAADRVPERVTGLVYVDAMVPENGDSCWSLVTDRERGWYLDYATGWDGQSPFTALYERLLSDPAWRTHPLASGHNVMRDAPDELLNVLLKATL
ncbi:zinc-binding dehydrogenase [Streptosporangium minutum]|uniref:zinc-binding dehydrogenase n=1 Tax=Streptosporangium minutum TaxID=569862 RepID=UPI001F60BE78|nr:zinc-binding dehydrogenase [Streptosporangium minutum]